LSKGKVVGDVRGDTFYISITRKSHQSHPPAIMVDNDALDQAKSAGAVGVYVTESDTGEVFQATIDFVRKYGTVLNFGHGDQIYLTLGNWIACQRGDRRPSLFDGAW
jgi:hypothetical protein